MADIFPPEADSPEGKETNNEHTSEESESKAEVSSVDIALEKNSNINERDPSTDAKSGEISDHTSTSDDDASGASGNELVTDIDNVFNFQGCSLQAVPTLEELASSDYIHNRQLAAKKILECLQIAHLNQDELQTIITVMCKLSEDEESMVRSELVKHIPYIALHCRYYYKLRLVISQQLVPYTVKLLNDSQITVRKLAQSALLVLLENDLIRDLQLSEWICPLIAQLAVCQSNLEEQRIEDVTVMCMMIPLVGEEITVKFFLDPFVALCCDPAFGIQMVCATKFGSVCQVVGTKTAELSLLPSFLNLCNDDLWEIRKACADVFVDVATVVSYRIRKEVLPHMFFNLLMDPSRHVKYSAYQSLGGFISTFAVSVDKYSDDLRPDDIKFHFWKPPRESVEVAPLEASKVAHLEAEELNVRQQQACVEMADGSRSCASRLGLDSPPSVAAKDGQVSCVNDNENAYNNFQFWRPPLPEVELDLDIDRTEATGNHMCTKVDGDNDVGSNTCDSKSPATAPVQTMGINEMPSQVDKRDLLDVNAEELPVNETVYTTLKEDLLKIIDSGRIAPLSKYYKSNSKYYKLFGEKGPEDIPQQTGTEDPCSQDIVPSELLERYLYVADQHASVFDMNKQLDDERIGHCAYNFPAVANTLGKKHWNIISPTFKRLARDMKWTVRRTIASFLHELAGILGHDITVTDLFPIFIELIKDVDEVRLKLVEHLADFLMFLNEEKREFLPAIKELSRLDNERNWRFRKVLAKQLKYILKWYDPIDVYSEFLPVALSLLQDKVFTVRKVAVELVVCIVSHLYEHKVARGHATALLAELDSTYRQARKWSSRQTYVMLCAVLENDRTEFETYFVDEIVPKLFSLAWDVVPNIRLAVSRCLAETLDIGAIAEKWPDKLQEVVLHLQADVDQDVRHFARLISPISLGNRHWESEEKISNKKKLIGSRSNSWNKGATVSVCNEEFNFTALL